MRSNSVSFWTPTPAEWQGIPDGGVKSFRFCFCTRPPPLNSEGLTTQKKGWGQDFEIGTKISKIHSVSEKIAELNYTDFAPLFSESVLQQCAAST